MNYYYNTSFNRYARRVVSHGNSVRPWWTGGLNMCKFVMPDLHLIITSHLLLLRFTSSYHYSLHPSYSPVQYYPFNHCIDSIAFHD